MYYLKCKSYFIATETSHIHQCLVASKEVGEALVELWQEQRGSEWRYKIIELKEVNEKKYKNLGLYKTIKEYVIPKDFCLT